MMHCTRIGITKDEGRAEAKPEGLENLLQLVMRKMEANGHLVIAFSVVRPSSMPNEVAEAYIATQTLEVPVEKPANRIVSGGN